MISQALMMFIVKCLCCVSRESKAQGLLLNNIQSVIGFKASQQSLWVSQMYIV